MSWDPPLRDVNFPRAPVSPSIPNLPASARYVPYLPCRYILRDFLARVRYHSVRIHIIRYLLYGMRNSIGSSLSCLIFYTVHRIHWGKIRHCYLGTGNLRKSSHPSCLFLNHYTCSAIPYLQMRRYVFHWKT